MSFFFDLIIIGFLLFSFLLFTSIFLDRRQKKFWEYRHPFWRSAILVSLALAWLTVFYGSFIEPERIVIKRQSIDLSANDREPIQIAFVSDIHIGPYLKTFFLKRLVKKIENLSPDLVLIGGDIIYAQANQVKYLSPLKRLAGGFPVFAVLGDHDYKVKKRGGETIIDEAAAKKVEEALWENNIQVLKNEALPLEKNQIWLLGIDDIKARRANPEKALDTIAVLKEALILSPANRSNANHWFKVALTHNPDLMLYERSSEFDLVLAGNTHGGQIRLPLIGPLGIIPDYLGQKYDQGLFDFNGTKLFITSGVGSSGPRSRLFNPPEIALLTIY